MNFAPPEMLKIAQKEVWKRNWLSPRRVVLRVQVWAWLAEAVYPPRRGALAQA